jgi:hypothetical protein
VETNISGWAAVEAAAHRPIRRNVKQENSKAVLRSNNDFKELPPKDCYQPTEAVLLL